MKLLFCHDGRMPIDKERNIYPNAFSTEVLTRYYTIADEITFFMRTKLIDPQKKECPKADMQKLRIVECPNLLSMEGMILGRRKAKKKLLEEIKNCDYVIARLHSYVGNLAIDIARKMNKPYLIELVGCPWDSFWNHSFKGRLVAPFMYYATKRRVKDANYVVYVTNEFLQKRYHKGSKYWMF